MSSDFEDNAAVPEQPDETPMAEPKTAGYAEEEIGLIEAVLFSSPKPLPLTELKKVIKSRHKGGVRAIIDQLNLRYTDSGRTFRIREVAGGFQFYLLPDFATLVEKYFAVHRERRLTPAGLETLAIIAYKQPITKLEIEHIRGVAADGVIQTLLERKMIKPAGRAERVGKPLLYATTSNFLEYFGISDLTQLPRLAEITLPKPDGFASGELELALDGAADSEAGDGDDSATIS